MGFTKHCQLSKHAWHDVVHTTTVSVTDTVGKRVARRFSTATSCPGTPLPGGRRNPNRPPGEQCLRLNESRGAYPPGPGYSYEG
jgi:hypothetical protein